MSPDNNDNANALPPAIVKHIEHLERVRQDFVANVSHELRTPLTVIHGYLETLIDKPSAQSQALTPIFLQMQKQTERMESLIEDLLLLSRLESFGEDKPIETPVSVSALLTTICNEAKVLSGDANHRIVLKANNTLLLLGCEEELRSLFSNLIFNAVRYTPAGGDITIEWYRKKTTAYFKVSDTGIGIAQQHIPRLTERFYRVDTARSRINGGTGLGLSIAKHVLLRHQASLTIRSKLTIGSVFTCAFPEARMILA